MPSTEKQMIALCLNALQYTVSAAFLHTFYCLSPPAELIANCSHKGCQETCAITPAGVACYCKSGYEIGPDGKTCKGEFCEAVATACIK